MIDIRQSTDTIEAINAALNNKCIVEVKVERDRIVVVEIKRTVKTPRIEHK